MSPFGVHVIMVDCLQGFSEVLPMPGHGGSTQSLKLIHACGGRVSDQTTVKNQSLSDSGKYRCEATLDFHLPVSIYFTPWTSSCLSNAKYARVIYRSSVTSEKASMHLTPSGVAQTQRGLLDAITRVRLSLRRRWSLRRRRAAVSVSCPASGRQHRLEDDAACRASRSGGRR